MPSRAISTASPQGAQPVPSSPPPPQQWLSRIGRFPLAVALIFCVVNSLAVANHVMWRDEWHTWLVSRFCPTLTDLFHAIQGYGRPAGWHIVAWLICKIGFYPYGLKIVCILISVTYVYLFARFSPLTPLQKVLFAFGYFPLYEFGTLLRDYNVELLLVTIACMILIGRKRRPLALAIVMALMVQVNSFAIFFAFVVGVTYLYDLWAYRSDDRNKPSLALHIACAAMILVSLGLAYAVMRPPPELWVFGMFPTHNSLFVRLQLALSRIWCAYLPFPAKSYWDSNFYDAEPITQTWGGLCFLVTSAILIWPRRKARVFYIVGSLVLLLFFGYEDYFKSIRYAGQLFLVLIFSYWIFYAEAPPSAPNARQSQLSLWSARCRQWYLIVLLAVQCIAAAHALTNELARPMSASLAAAQIIEKANPPDIPVIGDPDYRMESLSGYLDRPVYIAARRDYSTYIKCDTKRHLNPLSAPELAGRVKEYLQQEKRDVILVIGYFNEGFDARGAVLNCRLVGIAKDAMADENYIILYVPYNGQ